MIDRDTIIKLAREAGGLPDPMVFIGAYERFTALVAAAEREACAKVADQYAGGLFVGTTAEVIAAAIRERGNP